MGNSFISNAKSGNTGKVKKFLDGGCDIETRSMSGNTALLAAAEMGHYAVVNLLVKRGANINATNEFGITAIMLAAEKDHAKVVKCLISAGADLSVIDMTGRNVGTISTKGLSKELIKSALKAPDSRVRSSSNCSSSKHASDQLSTHSFDPTEMSTLEECRKSKHTVASTKAESSSPISLLSNDSSSGKLVLGRHSSLLEIQRSELVIMDRLCSGGFSTVYRGEWRYTGIAVKILRCKVGDKAYDSLQTELAVLSQLRHPRILTLMGVCRDLNMMDGTVALIMELMERGSLYSILHENSSSSYAPSNTIERLRLALDIADGMRFLHKSGVVHRDLKSANVLVGSDGRAKIADFGLSSYHQQAQTLVTNVISTPAYSSPEVIRGEGAITSSADVFSFGVILWELLTGLSPWEGKTTVQIIFMSMQGTNLSLSRQVRSDYPDVAHMMEKCFIGAASRPRFSELYIEISILLTEAIEGKIGTPPQEEIPEQTKHALSAKVLRRLSGTSLEREISGMNIGDDRRRAGSNAPERERSSATQSSPKRERRRHTESIPAASREVPRAPAPVRSASMPPLAPAQPISTATLNASHIPSHPEAIRSAMRTIPENMEWDSIESVRDNTGQRLSEFI